MQNLALAGKKIIFDVQPQHGFQMPPQDRRRNQLRNFSSLVAAVLDLVQRGVAQFLPRLVLLVSPARVPLRGLCIKVPTVVVDSLILLLEFIQQQTRVGQRFAFEMQKSHHHIGHLNAGIVDVVLHIHLLPGGAQQADKRVTQNRVAQVANVRGLVGIDAGVLHQRVNPA